MIMGDGVCDEIRTFLMFASAFVRVFERNEGRERENRGGLSISTRCWI
jgi:hypothetical protein